MNRALLFMAFFVCVTGEVRSQWIASETWLRSRNPIGWTDGIINSSQVGLNLSWSNLSIEINPRIVVYQPYRRGDVFSTLLSESNSRSNPRVQNYLQLETNRIDVPIRWNSKSRQRFLPGDSEVQFSSYGMAISISAKSLFWGPGARNSLILSGPSEGFPHLSFQVVSPIRTPLGSFDGVMISGRLDNSGQDPGIPTDQSNAFRPFEDKWRYISGFDASFSPRFIPGLSVGVSRTFVGYHTILDGWSDYFPMFQPLTKENFIDDNNPSGDDEWDQQLSAYFSWVFKDSGFRVYGELGRNDHSADVRDLIIEPEHSRAYVLGVEKKTESWHTVVEITQLAMTKTQELRASPIWYTHHVVRHGVTNRGQILGPEIGPGSNSWFTSIDYRLSDLNQMGISFERVHRQQDLYRRLFPGNPKRRWSDLTTSVYRSKRFCQLTVNGSVSLTKSFNYAFREDIDPWDIGVSIGIKYEYRKK